MNPVFPAFRDFFAPALAALVGLSLGAPALWSAEPNKIFRAGAATSNITSHLGGSMGGATQDRSSTHVHDELHARCLALDDGKTTLVFVVADSCAIPREVFDSAKRFVNAATGLPPGNMMMSATHTHSAPTAVHVFQSVPDPKYLEFLSRRIADGVRRALNNLEPARIGWGMGNAPRHVFNRRWWVKSEALGPNPFGEIDRVRMNPPPGHLLLEPAGPTDPEVSVISVVAGNGRPIAVYANYSLHYVGGVPPTHLSADYFGAFAENMKRRMTREPQDPPFVAMLSNGTSGNINNTNFRAPAPRKSPYEQIEFVADDLANLTQTTIEGITYHSWVALSVRQSELSLRVRKPSTPDVARAHEIVAAIESGAVPTREQLYARETLHLTKYPDEVLVILQTMRIGEVAVAAVPCEVFVEMGLELKREASLKVFTVSLANGYNGYLPTADHHEWGGYETWRARSSYLEVSAASKITARLLEHLAQLAAPGSTPSGSIVPAKRS